MRHLVFSLDRHRQKLYHLGLTPAKRSTLAEANEKRPALSFQKTYEKLLARFQAEAGVLPAPSRGGVCHPVAPPHPLSSPYFLT